MSLLGEVMSSERPGLVRLAARTLGSVADAEDVVQEVCESVWRLQPAIDRHDGLTAYLRSSVVNRCNSRVRRMVLERQYLALQSPLHTEFDDGGMRCSERRLDLVSMLAPLSQRRRQVIALRYVLDLSEAEIAVWLGISAGTVKSTLSRGLKAVREPVTLRAAG